MWRVPFHLPPLLLLLTSFLFASDLSSYIWKNRLLLVFSPSQTDLRFEAFNHKLLSERSAIDERDLIVFRVFEKGSSRSANQPLAAEQVDNLRRRFGIETGQFTVILIGKDGGVKMMREGGVELQDIFDRIDSMPMRRREMRERK
jgi:hypothetical protein